MQQGDHRDVLSWKAAWQSAAFRIEMLATIVILIIVLTLFSRFLEWVELRPGVVLADPVISAIEARDFTWVIFAIIYGGLIVGLFSLAVSPHRLMIALQSYIVMVCIRFGAMYVTPLDPPPGIIPLADPFVQFVGSGAVPTKDLFFSGHTSTLLLLGLATKTRWFTWSFFLGAMVVGVLIVWQHVHYAVDVLVAPFIAYTSYRLVCSFHRDSVQGG